MKFTKMQGAGNDFIIINNMDGRIPADKYSALAERLCTRKLSVGADGLMIIEKPETDGDFKMVFFNNDGSEAEMCGNGARCISRYGHDNGLSQGLEQRIETASGTVIGKRVSERMYTVRLNSPSLIEHGVKVTAEGSEYDVSYVELGVPGMPHAVVYLPSWEDIGEDKLRSIGRTIRFYDGFPKGANVTFSSLTDRDSLKAITFERGVEDFTLACGTGCGATVSALTLRGVVSGENVKLSVPGGDLFVTVKRTGDTVTDVFLTGPTNIVCQGEILDEDLCF